MPACMHARGGACAWRARRSSACSAPLGPETYALRPIRLLAVFHKRVCVLGWRARKPVALNLSKASPAPERSVKPPLPVAEQPFQLMALQIPRHVLSC
jgi:hypothetical protein